MPENTKPRRVDALMRGFLIQNKELYVKNKTEVKININKETIKMSDLIEKHDKLRKFLYS
jgi:hypothetical protein